MPFCPQCGVDNPPSARFCDQCGAALIPTTSSTAPVAQPRAAAVGPTVCPQCGAAAIPGEAFCDNCGAPLAAPARPTAAVPMPPASAGAPPQPVYPPPQPTSVAPAAPAPARAPAPMPPVSAPAPAAPRTTLAPARLLVTRTGAMLPLPQSNQAIIGRADPMSNFMPDVDLGSYDALAQGVGRRHARLLVQNGQMVVEDLDSTNGTFVNGQRLQPRQPQPLHDGDQLQLGRLGLQVRF
jgi:hypothetical protein